MPKPKHSSVIAMTLTAALGTVGFFAATLPAKSAVSSAATVSLRSTPLGRILVNSQGRTLYLFAKDPAGKSACSAGCANVWRPLVDVTKPSAGTGIRAALLGRAKRGDGRMQVTYHGIRSTPTLAIRLPARRRAKQSRPSAPGGTRSRQRERPFTARRRRQRPRRPPPPRPRRRQQRRRVRLRPRRSPAATAASRATAPASASTSQRAGSSGRTATSVS